MKDNPEIFWEPGKEGETVGGNPDNSVQIDDSSNEQTGEPPPMTETASVGAPPDGKSEAGNAEDTEGKDDQQDSAAKMKEQLVDVSKKVGKTLSDWGTKVAQKSGELIEQGKLEFKISSIERKISKAHRDAGEKLYNLWSQGRVEDRIILDLVGSDLEEISQFRSELLTLKELLENLKYEPSEKPEVKDENNS